MKKSTQKRLVSYFFDNIQTYTNLVLKNMSVEGYTQPEEAWLVDMFMYSEDHTPKVFDELKSFRNFILWNEDYIRNAINNINKIMDINSDYMKLHPFEKFLSVYNSYLAVEKMSPGLGKETISNWEKNYVKKLL